MPDRQARSSRLLRAGARGLVGAMAMTGARKLSTALDLVEQTPPEEILSERAPGLLRSLPLDGDAVVEIAHWGYGTAVGVAFGLLPDRIRRSRAAGPAYGVGTWLFYELVVEPALGIEVAQRRAVATRLLLLADHVLYGVIVAGQLAPEADRGRPRQETGAS